MPTTNRIIMTREDLRLLIECAERQEKVLRKKSGTSERNVRSVPSLYLSAERGSREGIALLPIRSETSAFL